MYNNNFVVCIKNKDNVLREDNGIVQLPFGSEYSIMLKNLNSVKAKVDVIIDGESALRDGRKILVSPNETVELEGFKENSKVTKKFKFVEKIEDIKKYRGDRVDDGIIKVEIQYEKKCEPFDYKWYTYTTPWRKEKYTTDYDDDYYTGGYIGNRQTCISTGFDNYYSTSYYNTSKASSKQLGSIRSFCYNEVENDNEDGITVEGNDTIQEFVPGHIGTLEDTKTVICIQLKGKVKETKINKPVYTKVKTICKYCGKKNNSSYKFCPNCGARILM